MKNLETLEDLLENEECKLTICETCGGDNLVEREDGLLCLECSTLNDFTNHNYYEDEEDE